MRTGPHHKLAGSSSLEITVFLLSSLGGTHQSAAGIRQRQRGLEQEGETVQDDQGFPDKEFQALSLQLVATIFREMCILIFYTFSPNGYKHTRTYVVLSKTGKFGGFFYAKKRDSESLSRTIFRKHLKSIYHLYFFRQSPILLEITSLAQPSHGARR